ncbi:MAG: hypothetical protein IPN94_02000 [Sphingobacteriales bacterium]|nr:hypothetical protein [Sphingobacteriales bacterium]
MSKTAEDIDIQRSRLYNKIEKYGLARRKQRINPFFRYKKGQLKNGLTFFSDKCLYLHL